MACRKDDTLKCFTGCVIDDDVQEIYPKMNDADGFIFGTPVNCGTETAILKTFVERSIWVFSKAGNKPINGCPMPRTKKKKAAMFIISSGIVPPALRWFCDDASKLLKDYIKCCFDTKIVASVYAGAVEKRSLENYFNKVQNGGEKLAEALKSN